MTQTKFFKVARALVVLMVRLAWILVKAVLLAAAAVLRAVSGGTSGQVLGHGEDVPPDHPAFDNPNDLHYPNVQGKRLG